VNLTSVLFFLVAAHAGAAELELRLLGRPDTTTRVTAAPTAKSSVTLLQVLREVYPDLRPDGRAGRFKGARVLPDPIAPDAGKPDASGIDLAKASGEAAYAVIEDGARAYVLISIEGMVLLARVAPDYRFLDALFVQTDPGGMPVVGRTFMLAPEYPGALVINSHHNSQQGFVSYLLLALVNGRLAPVYDGPLLYSYSNAENKCEPLVLTQALSTLEVGTAMGNRPADIAVEVLETRECTRAGRDVKLPGRTYSFRLTWDAKRMRYMGGSKELYLVNRKRMGG
jgi:hypothetical protein